MDSERERRRNGQREERHEERLKKKKKKTRLCLGEEMACFVTDKKTQTEMIRHE